MTHPFDKLKANAQRIVFSKDAKIIFIGDTHFGRGKLDKADDFYKVSFVLLSVLQWADKNGYTVIIEGDWLELYENDFKEEVIGAYPGLYSLIFRLVGDGRCYIIKGNHDWTLDYPEAYVAVIDGKEYLLAHGHQLDFWNHGPMWHVSRWVVRYIWRGLQYMGLRNQILADQKRHTIVEAKMREWTEKGNKGIFGHIHTLANEEFYKNSGSWVNGRGEGIIYQNGQFEQKEWR